MSELGTGFSWAFAGLTLGAAILATFASNIKRAILALWVVGLGVGAVYLTVGAEFLAIIQCIVSTLVTISLIFFSVMFGEYQVEPASKVKFFSPANVMRTVLALFLGAGFAAVIGLGVRGLPLENLTQSVSGSDLAALGRALTQDNLLSLEVLALILFLVLVGGGVIARLERSEPNV
ncbi:MAG: NADH-quinone oxidoreductase subunit J [Bdellovibrio sp.]|nr:NADH-quinone oxidoreductase subunit J [Bdellovibrio sp.]